MRIFFVLISIFISFPALALDFSKNYYGNYAVVCAYPGKVEHPYKVSKKEMNEAYLKQLFEDEKEEVK